MASRFGTLALGCCLLSAALLRCGGLANDGSGPTLDAGTDVRPSPRDAGSPKDRTTHPPADQTVPDDTTPPSTDCSLPDAGPPPLALTSLSVSASSDAAPAITLVPAFSPEIHDYYVRCTAGTNDLSVSMKASPGAMTELVAPTTSASAPEQTLSVSVTENQAIVANVTEGSSHDEYWVRCLPHDFPRMQWTPHADRCARTPGYYLIGTMTPGVAGYAIVLDTNGVPVWYRSTGGAFVYDVESLTKGDLSFSAYGWHLVQLSPYMTTSLPALDEHELRVLSNGHYVGLSSATQPHVDLTGLSIPLEDGGLYSYGPDSSILACNIEEFDTTGALVWTWKATDHFDPVTAMTYKASNLAQSTVEPFHCNALDVDPANGNILVSARHMDSIFYVERSSGTVLWKIGGSPPSKDGAVYVPIADTFFRQHDARLLPGWNETCSGGSGQISLFDDETDVKVKGKSVPARGVVYDVTIGGVSGGCTDGGTGGTSGATVAWQFANPEKYTSNTTGGHRVQADGSHLIDWGQSQPNGSQLMFTEVDGAGNDVLDLICPDESSSYRAVKLPLGALDLGALRSTAGVP